MQRVIFKIEDKKITLEVNEYDTVVNVIDTLIKSKELTLKSDYLIRTHIDKKVLDKNNKFINLKIEANEIIEII